MSFRLLRVPVNFLIRSVQFRKILNKMILQSTSKELIWLPTVTFITFIIRVLWIKGRFIIAYPFESCLKNFSGGCEPPQ